VKQLRGLDVVGDHGTMVGCGASQGQGDARIIAACIEVEEASDEVGDIEAREESDDLVARDLSVPLPDPKATGDVIEPQRGSV
jgi:hypothetical protein